jgi:hypothetical protein
MELGAAQLLLALGLWLVAEGMILALAPGKIEDILETIRDLPLETRRTVGLVAVAAGVGLIWLITGWSG